MQAHVHTRAIHLVGSGEGHLEVVAVSLAPQAGRRSVGRGERDGRALIQPWFPSERRHCCYDPCNGSQLGHDT